jgi:hypothetical protein
MPFYDGTCTRCGAQDQVFTLNDYDDFGEALCGDCINEDERAADAEERQRAELGDVPRDFGNYIDDCWRDQRDEWSNVELDERAERADKEGKE